MSDEKGLILLKGYLYFFKTLETPPERFYAVLQGRTILCFDSPGMFQMSQVKFAVALDKVNEVIKIWKGPQTQRDLFIIWLRSSENSMINFGFQAESEYEQGEWYRYLNVSCLLRLPDDHLSLLPSQVKKLRTTIKKLKSATLGSTPSDCSYYISIDPCPPTTSKNPVVPTRPPPSPKKSLGELPTIPLPKVNQNTPKTGVNVPNEKWFPNCMNLKVKTREESEKVLRDNTDNGNFLLRKRETKDKYNFAASVREVNTGVYRHFKIEQLSNGTFNIFLDNKHRPLDTWKDLVNFFIEKGHGKYVPIDFKKLEENFYDTSFQLDEGDYNNIY